VRVSNKAYQKTETLGIIMNRKVFIILFLLISIFSFCKKGGENTAQYNFTLQGTVYVDEIPTSNVLVECGTKKDIYERNWYTSTNNTDEAGTYIFRENVGKKSTYGANYRVRVKNPITNYWTDYKSGSSPLGLTVTKDFHIFSDE